MRWHKLILHSLILLFLFNSFVFAGSSAQRIISLGPSLTEELYLLGVEDSIVGVTTYCTKPKPAQQKEKVGTVVGVNVEKIVSLDPDIILATPLVDAKDKRKLEDLGLNVVNFTQVKDFTQICEQFLMLGEIVGKKEKAQDIILKANQKVNNIKSSIPKSANRKVFIQVGANPLFTMNKDFFINDIIKCAGGINIAENAGSGLYSRENVISANPDFIIIATMGMVGEQEKTFWQRYKTLNAVKNNNIYIIDSDLMCVPTPLSFVAALEQIVGFLYDGQDKL